MIKTFQCGSQLHSMNVSNHWRDIWWSYPSKMSSKTFKNLREKEKLKMRISTKPWYKLFSMIQNYFLWMFQIIERIYDDPIPQNKLEKLRKTWNLKIWISTKLCYKLFSVVQNYFLCIFQIIERIYDDPIPQNVRHILENYVSAKICIIEYRLNHTTNCSIWFNTTF